MPDKHNKWFNKSYRRCLVDMHIADWNKDFFSELNPANYAGMMALAGVDTAIIYAGSCLGICNWPAKYGHMHKQLKGRDILKEITAECRKKKLNVVVYFNIWSRWAYDTHPEWRMILPNGKGTVEDGWRFGLCCPNTGYRQYVLNMIEDLCSSHDMDGIWIDMIGWFGKICYCPGCRAKFLAETGQEPPRKIDWQNPDWVLFQRKREEWLGEFAETVVKTIRKSKPGISATLQNAAITLGWAGGVNLKFTQQGDYLAGDFYAGAAEISMVCKLLAGLSKNKPMEFMVSRCENLGHHTTDKSREILMLEACSAIANNCAFVIIDAIDPAGTLNRKAYEKSREIFNEVRRYETYLSADSSIAADVAIYWSFESLVNPAWNGRDVSEFVSDNTPVDRIRNIVETFVEYKIPFTLITEKQINNLADFQILILPAVTMMSPQEAEAIRKFVKAGGKVYASGETSLYDKMGIRQEDFQLADVFGVSYSNEKTAEKITYISPAGKGRLFAGECSKKYPLMLEDGQLIVRAHKTTEVIGKVTLPYTDPQDNNLFASAISNPPGKYTKNPALTLNRHGRGLVLYSAGDLEKMTCEKHRKIFSGMIRDFLKEKVFETDAPKPVEITVFRHEKKKRLIVNILNYQKQIPPVPVHDVRIKINLRGHKPVRLIQVPEEKEVPFEISADGRVEFMIKKIDMFAMFLLQLE